MALRCVEINGNIGERFFAGIHADGKVQRWKSSVMVTSAMVTSSVETSAVEDSAMVTSAMEMPSSGRLSDDISHRHLHYYIKFHLYSFVFIQNIHKMFDKLIYRVTII